MADGDNVVFAKPRPRVMNSLLPRQEAVMDAVTGQGQPAYDPLAPPMPKLSGVAKPTKSATPSTGGSLLNSAARGLGSLPYFSPIVDSARAAEKSLTEGDQSGSLLNRLGHASVPAVKAMIGATLPGKIFRGFQAIGRGASDFAEGVIQGNSPSTQIELKTPFSGNRRPAQPATAQASTPQTASSSSIPQGNHYPIPAPAPATSQKPGSLIPKRPGVLEPIDREMAQGIGSGSVLQASQQEKDTLNRMRRGVFDTGSRSTRDMQAQASDLEYQRGQSSADAASVRQRGEIAAQGEAQRGIEAEKVKGLTAERDAARTYRQTEQDQRRDERRYEIEERGRIQAESKKDMAIDKSQNESARRNDSMFKDAETLVDRGEGLSALSKMVDISNAAAADKHLDPNIKDYYIMRANTVAHEQARALAPKLTSDKLVSLRNALLKFKGDVNAPEVQAIIASGKA